MSSKLTSIEINWRHYDVNRFLRLHWCRLTSIDARRYQYYKIIKYLNLLLFPSQIYRRFKHKSEDYIFKILIFCWLFHRLFQSNPYILTRLSSSLLIFYFASFASYFTFLIECGILVALACNLLIWWPDLNRIL